MSEMENLRAKLKQAHREIVWLFICIIIISVLGAMNVSRREALKHRIEQLEKSIDAARGKQ